MRFTLLMSYSEAAGAAMSPDEMAAGQAEFDRYGRELSDAGVLVAGEVFTSVVEAVTVRGGQVVDAPDDSAEQLSGFFLIDAADADAAVEWAKKCPAADWGTMVVRPTALTLSERGWGG